MPNRERRLNQALLSDREHLERRLPRESGRPVYTAIRAAFIDRFARYYALLTETVAKSVENRSSVRPERLSKAAVKIEKLDRECTKLVTLLFPITEGPMAIRARRWDSQLGKRDWKDPEIVKTLRRNLRRWKAGRGQPAILQPIGLRALEMRIVDLKRWSWNAIPRELCRCGAAQHRFQCRQNIRREVYLLKDVLNSLGVKLPPEK